MWRIGSTVLAIALAAYIGWQLRSAPEAPTSPPVYTPPQSVSTSTSNRAPRVEVIAENLTVPWELLFLPGGEMLVTERPGRLVFVKTGNIIDVPNIRDIGEGGLLGAATHPQFSENNFLYLYQTTQSGLGVQNQIVRYRLQNNELVFDRVLVDNLPGARYHDGGRLAFGPDGYLYATVGDAQSAHEAQDRDTLEGTIIRIDEAGNPAPGNPFDTLVYSYGHRNPQGLAWDAHGNLWSSEHGRSVGGSGFDEINKIVPGGNFGWPDSQGDTVRPNTIAPTKHSTANVTWAPGDLAYLDGTLYMPGLRGQTLYEAVLRDGKIVAWHEHLVDTYGRLRTVVVGPDGLLYVLTSNRDGRGDPETTDDRIIRINPDLLSESG